MILQFASNTTINGVTNVSERLVPGVNAATGQDGIEFNITFDPTTDFDALMSAARVDGAWDTITVKQNDGTVVGTYTGYTDLKRVGRDLNDEGVVSITMRAVKYLA